jgi:hypothetical protein
MKDYLNQTPYHKKLGSSPFRVGRDATVGSGGIGRSANRVASMDAGH